LEAIGIGEGDRVLVPTFTFTATAEVVRYLRADPVFVDCDRETFCVTASQMQRIFDAHRAKSIEHSAKAIIPVHFGGHPCEVDNILKFAKDQRMKVMEDAAHALPTFCRCSKLKAEGSKQESQSKGRRMVGTIGDVTCFSFYANKTMTTGEGGMLCTDDDEIAKRVKVMRLHGINRDVWDRFSTGASWEYDVIAPGFKYNMPDINAALGIHQLKKVESFRDKRQRIAEIYYEELKDIPRLALPKLHCAMEDHSWYLFNVLIEPDNTKNGIDRDSFIDELAKRDIGTSVHYKPLHRMTYYKEKYGLKPEMFPNAERVFERCVSLPMFSAMTDEQVDYVIKNIKEVLD